MNPKIKGLTVFLIATFALSWAAMLGAPLLLGLSIVNPFVQLMFALTPGLVAVVVRKWVTAEGFGDAGLALRLRTNWRHYLIAWLAPFALVGATLAVAAIADVWTPSLSAFDTVADGMPAWVVLLVLLLAVPLLTPIYWGEEFGWTSYLRLRLFPGRPVLSTLGTGLIWAVWHFPLPFVGYLQFGNVAMGLTIWTISFICQEFVLSWLRFRSGTIWTTSLAHAGNNMVLFLLSGAALESQGASATTVTALVTVPLLALSVWIAASGRLREPEAAVDTLVSAGDSHGGHLDHALRDLSVDRR